MSRPFARILGGEQESRAGAEEVGRRRGLRGWLGSRRRGDSSGDDGAPKSPTASSQGQEMTVVDLGVVSPVSSRQHGGSSPPTSPLSRNSAMEFYAPQPMVPAPTQPILENPGPTVRREDVDMAGDAVRAEQTHMEARVGLTDLEVQEQAGNKANRRCFWQKGSWGGLQSQLVVVVALGVFLVTTLTVYLALALTTSLQLRHEVHVIFVLVILLATMFFCHALVKLSIVATSPGRFQRLSRNFSRIPSVAGPGGYANPTEPIRIHTPYNNDDPALVDPIKSPPPVYGLWRCSVRVNPDQFYWVRRTSNGVPTIPEGGEDNQETRAIPRPPSYTSDDGVTYALASSHQPRHGPPLAPPAPAAG